MRKNSLILDCGLKEKAVSILRLEMVKHRGDPRALAKRLNEDPEVIEKLNGKRIMPQDVRIFKEWVEKATATSIEAIVANNQEANTLVAKVHERMSILVRDADRAKELFNSAYEDYHRFRGLAGDDEERWPMRQFNAVMKALQIEMGVIETLKSDEEIKKFIRAGTINVDNGMALNEVLDLIIQTGEELGHSKDETMSAFARSRNRPRRVVLDAEIIDQKGPETLPF